jgi:transcriptional regulator with XRE-family HTH domain
VISPYVRRLRLARELRRLREREGYTHPKLAAAIGENRAKISRLENAHIRPDPADILKILDVLGVEGEEWSTIMTITREAAERGWWESSIAAMGERQARTADLEAGAVTIWEYQTTFPPGLLQTEAYTRALSEWDDLALGGSRSDPDAMADARAGRQRMLRRRHNEVTYEVIIDEEAIRRPSAPLDVFAEPLQVGDIVHRPHAETLETVGVLLGSLGEMGMQPDPLLTRQRGRTAHELGAGGEGGARRHRDLQHGAERRVVEGIDGALRGDERLVGVLAHFVGR